MLERAVVLLAVAVVAAVPLTLGTPPPPPPPAAPESIAVVADEDIVDIVRMLDADYYVDRLRVLRIACAAAGGRDPVPIAEPRGVFMECWKPAGGTAPEEWLWSRWVVYGDRVSAEPPPPAGP